MKVLELFAGTRSIGKAFEARGHEVFSVEWDKNFQNISLYADIGKLTAAEILEKFGTPDVIWASPDCTTFSIAAISHHRRKNPETGNLDAVSDYAKFCDAVDKHMIDLIRELNPALYFIENPRGGMRKMSWMHGIPRYTVTYCQYGDTRQKPTDIWTNHPDPKFKPMCRRGDTCHVAAPRGSSTGTQGLKGSKERSVIPRLLCEHIVDICEQHFNEREKGMELHVNEVQIPERISFNYDELKQELAEVLKRYENIVYTADQMKLAKTDKAALNKLKKALNDERIKRERDYMLPFLEFKKRINDLIALIDKPVALIDRQVKEYEEQKKCEKRQAIEEYFDGECDFPMWLKLDQIFKPQWLNATVSMKSVQDELKEIQEKICSDLAVLSEMPAFAFEATEVYKQTLNIQTAVNEGKRLADIQARKAEAERLKAEETDQAADDVQQECQPEVHSAGQWIAFKAFLTVAQAVELRKFFERNGIEFKSI